jgi:hypothetical protein
MHEYTLEELIKIFGGHGWEFSNQEIYQDGDFNLPWALKCVIEDLLDAKKEIMELNRQIFDMKDEMDQMKTIVLKRYGLSSCPWPDTREPGPIHLGLVDGI